MRGFHSHPISLAAIDDSRWLGRLPLAAAGKRRRSRKADHPSAIDHRRVFSYQYNRIALHQHSVLHSQHEHFVKLDQGTPCRNIPQRLALSRY